MTHNHIIKMTRTWLLLVLYERGLQVVLHTKFVYRPIKVKIYITCNSYLSFLFTTRIS